MDLLPDTQNYGLRIRRECRERFLRHRLQRKPLVSEPGMHHGTSVTHVPWCMSGSLTRGSGENVPGIPSASATLKFVHLVRGPWTSTCFPIGWAIMGAFTNHCAQPWQFIWCHPTKSIELPMIRDVMILIWRHCTNQARRQHYSQKLRQNVPTHVVP